jgi:transcriptional regulator with XRE-family HTH domain
MEKSIHSEQYAAFLKVFRRVRKQAGLTQNQLAQRVRETQSFISKCERGERRIDLVELRAFCKAVGISLKQFTDAFERALDRQKTRHR